MSVAATAVTGNVLSALTAAANRAAVVARVSPATALARTRVPPIYNDITPVTEHCPVSVTAPFAATAAASSGTAMQYSSRVVPLRRAMRAMLASWLPWPHSPAAWSALVMSTGLRMSPVLPVSGWPMSSTRHSMTGVPRTAPELSNSI